MSTVINQIVLGDTPDFNISTIASTYAYWRADRPNTLTIDASNKVVGWKDSLGSGRDWAQSSSSNAPSYNPAKASNGRPALDFNKLLQIWMDSTTMSRPAGDMSVWFMVDRVNATGATEDLFSTQTGLLVIASISGTTGNTGYYDSAWRQGANGVTGNQALGFQYSGTGGSSGTVYRSMTSLGSFSYTTAKAIGGTTGLGAYYDGTAQWFDGCIYEMIIYNSALSFSQRSTLMDYWSKKYRFDPNA